ncbi:divalent metal cation transporter [Woeseiaceae bacterium]|nr:divalent metal cation transporter [Woeseiaceae bacterium]
MSNIFARLGPGLMLAAVGVGVSHLVYSTQAGADYGLSLLWLIIAITLIKYPAFRFAVDYANATGESLVRAYGEISKLALVWLMAGFIVDTFIATSAVSMVTAGLFISVFDIPYSAPQVAIAITLVSALILMNGQYAKAERIVKVLVVVFSILTLLALFFSFPLLGSNDRAVFGDLTMDVPLSLFVIAVAGWMPMPTNGAILFSKWVSEKRKISGEKFKDEDALRDFKLGYFLLLFLAICFVVLGTAVLFQTGRPIPVTPPEFAAELFSVFTETIGDWSYPIIASAGLAVMWSTQIALMDVMPRLTDRLSGVMMGRSKDLPDRYKLFSAIQVLGIVIILLFFLTSFKAFLYFATSIGLIAAPTIGYYNYLAITSDKIPAKYRPKTSLVVWNWVCIFIMTLFAIGFIYTRIVM